MIDGFESEIIEYNRLEALAYKGDTCPICGSYEENNHGPETVYRCGSSEYIGLNGTFIRNCMPFVFIDKYHFPVETIAGRMITNIFRIIIHTNIYNTFHRWWLYRKPIK
jgi:hypothetical protein